VTVYIKPGAKRESLEQQVLVEIWCCHMKCKFRKQYLDIITNGKFV